ncbi:hypothetical protein BKA70DRAFT_350603 [Coprinopsis sp. MPI-PUGE-AT-0042]|nr:hypothetical protein BKA70DRAFT_350603 [Coprinopsis sp. MPI-PUGE-AT-0042]
MSMVREYQQPLATDAAYWKLRINELKKSHPLKLAKRSFLRPKALLPEFWVKATHDRRSSMRHATFCSRPQRASNDRQDPPKRSLVHSANITHLPRRQANLGTAIKAEAAQRHPTHHRTRRVQFRLNFIPPCPRNVAQRSRSGCAFLDAFLDVSTVVLVVQQSEETHYKTALRTCLSGLTLVQP